MIEIVHPGIMSLIVDGGRYGHREVGVPPSSALDSYALSVLNHLLGNEDHAPAIEVFGEKFSLRFNADACCAITGAKVRAGLQGRALHSWTSFEARAGDILTIDRVMDGFRYYVGFASTPVLEKIIGSYSTNVECRFGGYRGRALQKGDRIDFETIRMVPAIRIPEEFIPKMNPPHTLRVLKGPENDYFTADSLEEFMGSKARTVFSVSTKANRTGIRLEGKCLTFKAGADDSIISEGLLSGSIQVPGDGLPIIQLHERTIGGYARPAVIAKVDHDLLAHLKPGNSVTFEMIEMDEADSLYDRKLEIVTLLKKNIGGRHV
jgi:antagonist of KipI